MIFMGLGAVCLIAALVCWVIILIDAFKSELWKGFLGFFCGLYLLYYAITEYSADNKWLIIAGCFGGGIVGDLLIMMGGGMAAGAPGAR